MSASALLVFASNTAIIGSYHVFLALSRMEFFPAFLQRRNRLRGTPHYSILSATAIPIVVLVLVRVNISLLGDMYAFGLLGAFTLTCIGMDVVRHRDRKARRRQSLQPSEEHKRLASSASPKGIPKYDGTQEDALSLQEETALPSNTPEEPGWWARSGLNFGLGILTTLLVVTAWATNLVAKPMATAFSGSVSSIGMLIAYICVRQHQRQGRIPLITTGVETQFSRSLLAVLSTDGSQNEAVIKAAVHNAGRKSVVFLYLGLYPSQPRLELFQLVEPHLNDPAARDILGRANHQAKEAQINCR